MSLSKAEIEANFMNCAVCAESISKKAEICPKCGEPLKKKQCEDNNGKNVAFYTESVNAWFTTRLERDKSLLTLSGAAVGLLVTLITTLGITSSISLFLYGTALLSFVICIFVILFVFSRNSRHIEKVISGEEEKDSVLQSLDIVAPASFVFGVIIFSIIGISIGLDGVMDYKISNANLHEKDMKIRKSKPKVKVGSLSGMANLRQSPKADPEEKPLEEKPLLKGENNGKTNDTQEERD